MVIDVNKLRIMTDGLLSRMVNDLGKRSVDFPDELSQWNMAGKTLYQTRGVIPSEAARNLIVAKLQEHWEAIENKQIEDLSVVALADIAALLRAIADYHAV